MNKKLILLVLLVLAMAVAIAQVIPYPVDTDEYNAYKQGLIGKGWIPASAGMTEKAGMPKLLPLAYQQRTRVGLLVPYDASFQLAFSGSDDGYTSSIAIPFAFDFYGTTQSSFYINNNGNVSFGNPYSTYNPSGFPIAEYPMLSAFWADVDTRLAASGKVYYKVESTRITVIWNGVGYYNNKTDKLNTFELIFTNGTDPLIGIGNNVAFSYGDMQWTTGDASGGTNGFGGTPSTVGLNKGDGINYGLIGRFDHEGTDYNGPGGAASGISYLDNQLLTFNTLMGNNIPPLFTNVPTAPVLLQVGDSRTLNISVLSPLPSNTVSAVVQHNFTSGLTATVVPGNPCQISIQITGDAANLGNHTVTIVATDNGTPVLESTTSFTIGIISLSEYVLVANRLSADISVIDTATNAVYGPFLTGQLGSDYLVDLVVSPNSQFALVSNFNNNTVYQLDISNPLNPILLASYVLGFQAEDITLSYDGRFAIVADGGSTTMLAVIDLQSRATIQNLNISPHYAQGVSISIDGKVLVNDYHNGYVYQYLLNLQTGMLTDSGSSIAISSAFNSAISPSGEYAIACGGSASNTKLLKLNQDNSITVVQTLEGIGSQSALYSPDGSKVLIAVISSPSKLHVYNVQPDGTLLFASSHNLSEYSSGGYFGVDPLAINSTNSKAYASNLYETYANVHAIDLTTGTLTYLPTGSPAGLAIANLPLKAYFSFKATNLLLTNAVQFKQFSIGAPQSYLWSFGDGNSSTAQNPNHEYSSPGIYTVSLTVTRGTYSNTATQSVTIAFDANIHLTAAGSPYFFSNSINIMAGQTLTIDSGVMLNFAPGTGLTVNGIISANGATFSGSETAGWNGIVINSTQSPLTFNNCTILHGIQALTLESTSLNILNLLINKTNVFPDELGISVQGYANVTLTNVQVLNYTRGIVFNNPDLRISSSPTLSNVRIRNTSSSVRTDCTGLEVIGAVALIINGAEIEEYDNGIIWDGQGTSFRTTPTLGNVRIRNTSSSVRNASFGMKLLNLSSVIVESDSIGGYPNGLHIENNLPDNRVTSTATLGNVRIRNTSSSVRTDTYGATLLGSIASTINNMEISDYSTGIYIEGDSTATRTTATTTLGNVRIRNTSSSVRSATYGLKLVNLGSVQAINDTIEGYTNGFELLSNSQTRTTTTATLGNVRIRNTSSSVRSATLGVKLQGNILATIDGLDVEDYSTGIYYEGDGMPFGRTTPTLGNVRIRNTSSSVREPAMGIVLKNLAGISLTKSSIYPKFADRQRSNVAGIGISAESVTNANIQQNTVWGFSNGLSLTDSPAATFSNNVLWSNAGELTDPILLVNSSPIISSNDISYAAGVYPGTGNLDRDPLFVDPVDGNFYLKPRSPLRDTNIGALPFDFDVMAGWHSYSMHAGWNLMGVPYMPRPNQNPAVDTPVAIFADDLSPFYVAPNYTSIVQMNNNTVNTSLQDALGHIVFNYTGSYNTPAHIGAGVGYWVRNPYNYSTSIDVYGLMDDGSYNLGVPGADGSNNGWYLLANPYDRPIKWADGSMVASGQITPYAQVYDYAINRFLPMPSDDLTEIPPWSGFFIKSRTATDTLYINYPAAGRQIPDNATTQTGLSASGDAKPVWELALQAAAANSSDTVTLGIAKNARDTYDPMDVPKLPNAPFLMNGIIKLSVLNIDWTEQAGDYTRDIRNNESGSWSWNLQLNAEALLVDGRLCESLVLGLNTASRIPAGYRFSLTNLQSGQCIDLSTETMLLSLNIDAQNSPEGSMPWLIPLKLEAYSQNAAISAQQEIISTSNYPNPFNPETTISYNLGKNSPVSLKIYNLKGQLVTSLVNASQNSGLHSVTWNGKDSENRSVASGFYFYRLKAGSSTVTRKILMMK